MRYTVFVERYAQKQIMKLGKKAVLTIKTAISRLADNPRPQGYIKLKGEEAYRIRVGNYRILYEIDDDKVIVTIVAAGHRKDIYR